MVCLTDGANFELKGHMKWIWLVGAAIGAALGPANNEDPAILQPYMDCIKELQTEMATYKAEKEPCPALNGRIFVIGSLLVHLVLVLVLTRIWMKHHQSDPILL